MENNFDELKPYSKLYTNVYEKKDLTSEKKIEKKKTVFRYYLFKHLKNGIFFILILLTYFLWIKYYHISLKGGDLNWIIKNVNNLSADLFKSFFACSSHLWLILFVDISRKQKYFIYTIDIATLISLFYYDHGELLDYHGMFNFLLFIHLIIILDGIGFILYLWWRKSGGKRFIFQFILLLIGISGYIFLNLKYNMKIWGNGFLNRKLENKNNTCPVNVPYLWFDILPNRIMNFWAGPLTCSRKEQFHAFFDSHQNNKLVVEGCSKENITYMILPETINMTLKEKKRRNFDKNVIKKMKKKIYHYTEPVDIKDAEAVYVTCGNQHKLVTRIANGRVKPQKKEQPIDKLNVLMLYIDALNRRQFFRNLPKAAKKLENLSHSGVTHLNQFFRYGIIGPNTSKNSLGLFTGLIRKKGEVGIPIWEEYKNKGYVVGITDNSCYSWNSVYNSRVSDLIDHEFIAPFCLPEYHSWSNFKGPFSILQRCITGDYVHNYSLNYTRDFIKMYDGKNPWFFRSSYSEAHEITASVLNVMDDDLVRFFDSLNEETLNRTAIVILSDHGLHYGTRYLFSEQGRTEHKLPLLTTLIPECFLNKYPKLRENLDKNEQKLISAFDIYATFQDLLNFDINRTPEQKFTNKRNKRSKKRKTKYKYGKIFWGKSLLREIPDRTCEQILIPEEYCFCN